MKKKTELLGFRARAGGATLSETKMLTGKVIPLLSLPPSQPAGTGGHKVWVSINLANTIHPALVVP